MSRIRKIINEDGEIEAFDRDRLVSSILNAIRSADHHDEWVAEKIAPVVEMALERYCGDRIPACDDIAHYVQQALQSFPDLQAVLEAYDANRERRRQLKVLHTNTKNPNSEETQTQAPDVVTLGRAERSNWQREKIVAALIRENHLDLESAQGIAETVEKRVHQLQLGHISTTLLRALVENELLERGGKQEQAHAFQLGMPTYDLDQVLFPIIEEQAFDTNQVTAKPEQKRFVETPEQLQTKISQALLRQYALTRIHSSPISEALLHHSIALEGLETPLSFDLLRLDLQALLNGSLVASSQDKQSQDPSRAPFFSSSLVSPLYDLNDALDRVSLVLSELLALQPKEVILEKLDIAFAPFVTSQAEGRRLARSLAARIRSSRNQSQIILGLEVFNTHEKSKGSLYVCQGLLEHKADMTSQSRLDYHMRVKLEGSSIESTWGYTLLEGFVTQALREGGIEFEFTKPVQNSKESQKTPNLFGERLHQSPAFSSRNGRAYLNLLYPLLEKGVDSTASYYTQLEKALGLALQALRERQQFVERFYTRYFQRNPESSSSARAWANLALKDLEPVQIGFLGLMEAVEVLGQKEQTEEHSLSQRLKLAQGIVSYLRFKLEELAQNQKIEAELTGDVPKDFAQEVLHMTIKDTDKSFQKLLNKNVKVCSAGLDTQREEMPWLARLQHEASMHPLTTEATFVLESHTPSLHQASLLHCLQQTLKDRTPRIHRLRIQARLQQCSHCGNMAPVEIELCPCCGTRNWSRPHDGQGLFFQLRNHDQSGEEPHSEPQGHYKII